MPGNTLAVCQGPSCTRNGSRNLLVDIEELAAGGCEVIAGGCLDRCEKGPNIEVLKNGKRKIVEGNSTFQKVESIVKSEGGVKFNSTQSSVAALKYEIRRSQDTKDQATKVEKALKALGSQAKRESTQPRLTAELLVLRARATMKEDIATAMKDASRALELFPNFAAAHVALAVGFELMERWQEAADAISRALELEGVSLDTKEAYAIEKRVNDKCEELDAGGKAERAKAEAEAKAKAEAEAKQKAAAEAKKKAEAKRKAQAAAKKKREAEQKKKAEEEEARAKAEREEAEAKANAEKKEAEAKAEQENVESEAKAKAEAEGNVDMEQQDSNKDGVQPAMAEQSTPAKEVQSTDAKVEPVSVTAPEGLKVNSAPDAKAPPTRSPYVVEAAVSKASDGVAPTVTTALMEQLPTLTSLEPLTRTKAPPPSRGLWGFITCCAPNPITDEGGETPIQYAS